MQGIHALGDGRFRAEPRIRHGLPDHLSRAIRLQPDVVFKVFFLLIAGANALVFETKMADRLLALQPGEASPTAFRAIGALSLVSWFFVLYFGRMLPYLGTAY